jgi:hypothetical protein
MLLPADELMAALSADSATPESDLAADPAAALRERLGLRLVRTEG